MTGADVKVPAEFTLGSTRARHFATVADGGTLDMSVRIACGPWVRLS